MKRRLSYLIIAIGLLCMICTAQAETPTVQRLMLDEMEIAIPETCEVELDEEDQLYTIVFPPSLSAYMLWQFVEIDTSTIDLTTYVSQFCKRLENGGDVADLTVDYKQRDDGEQYAVCQDRRAGAVERYYVFLSTNGVHVLMGCTLDGNLTEPQRNAFDAVIKTACVSPAVIEKQEEEAAYKERCQEYTYKSIARNPEKVKGQYAKLQGKVIQVIENGLEVSLRVNVTEESGQYKDTVYVTYSRKSQEEDRILEDDIVTMWGVLAGLQTYQTIFSSQVTIPLLNAEYIQIDE